jgi:hypothetical protein
MAQEMVFTTDYEKTRYTPYIHRVSVLHLPYDLAYLTEQEEFADDSITIDDENVPLAAHVTQALARTINGAYRWTWDCTTFATALSGGDVERGLFALMRNKDQWTARFTYRDTASLNDAARAPIVLEPTALGKVVKNEGGDNTFQSRHTAVRLDPNLDLYASKLGPGPVCIADLRTTAELYTCDTVAPMLTADVWTGWRRQRHPMHYETPDASTAQASPNVTSFSASRPSWLARMIGVAIDL